MEGYFHGNQTSVCIYMSKNISDGSCPSVLDGDGDGYSPVYYISCCVFMKGIVYYTLNNKERCFLVVYYLNDCNVLFPLNSM